MIFIGLTYLVFVLSFFAVWSKVGDIEQLMAYYRMAVSKATFSKIAYLSVLHFTDPGKIQTFIFEDTRPYIFDCEVYIDNTRFHRSIMAMIGWRHGIDYEQLCRAVRAAKIMS